MLVIPAIDLRRRRCVRLYKGDPHRETIYSDDPVEVARQWERLGARMLHVVDLDGAFTGRTANRDVVAAMGCTLTIPFQLGGGIRSREAVEKALSAGADRVILGTVTVEQPQIARGIAEEFGRRIIVGIDARDGLVAVKGWTSASPVRVRDLALQVEQWGVKEIVYTDTARDGTLAGPNLPGLEELLDVTDLQVIVSGGIGTREDLFSLNKYSPRLRGVIIGQAFYSNRLTLSDAVEAVSIGTGRNTEG